MILPCRFVFIEILGARQRRQRNGDGIFELVVLDELRNIVEVLRLHLRRDQDMRNDEDAYLPQYLDSLLVLLHIRFLVEARERIRADGFDPENQISKADVIPLLEKFRVLADVVDAAITRQLLLDARLLNRVGKLAGVVRIGECVVVAEVYVLLLHALQICNDLGDGTLPIETEIGMPDDTETAPEGTTLCEQRETGSAAVAPRSPGVVRDPGLVVLCGTLP